MGLESRNAYGIFFTARIIQPASFANSYVWNKHKVSGLQPNT